VNYAFIDLETTCANEREGSILEVGCIIANPEFQPLAEFDCLVEPLTEHLALMPEVVVEMHRSSGLLAELEANDAREDAGHERDDFHPRDADLLLEQFLEPFTVKGRLILAGSGVGHFDSRWLRLHLPRSSKLLTYWTHDVGVIRRELASVPVPLPDAPSKPHRALADAHLHLEEARLYRYLLEYVEAELSVAAASWARKKESSET